jgi:ABC-type sugar transport system permease subunit
MASQSLDTTRQGTAAQGQAARVVGLALVLPAAFACLVGLVLPSAQTALLSFQDASMLREPEFVGAANYAFLGGDATFSTALGFTAGLLGGRLLAVAVLPLLLALAAATLGSFAHGATRLLFALPLALLAPVPLLLASRLTLIEGSPLADPRRAPLTLIAVDSLLALVLALGLLLPLLLMSLRGLGNTRSWRAASRPLLAVWLLALLATIALTLQSFTPSFLLTNGGPQRATTSLALLQYLYGFQQFRFGLGAAVATLTLAVSGLLGLGAWLVIMASGLRLASAPAPQPAGRPRQPNPLAALALVVLVLLGIGLALRALSPLALSLATSYKQPAELFDPGAPLLPQEPTAAAYEKLDELWAYEGVIANSLVPPAALLMVQLPLAYLAALGIGALRPLGRHSEWLLLPFSPWLFVGAGPLSLVAYQRLAELGLLNTPFALIPPLALSVPMLFVLSLFFRGQAPRWRGAVAAGESEALAFLRHLVLPSLPLAALLAAAGLLVSANDLLWPLIVGVDESVATLSTALARLAGGYATQWPLLGAAITRAVLPLAALALPALLVFHLFVAGRMVISGEE